MGSFPRAARDRDLQRYYQPWLDAQNTGRPDMMDSRGDTPTHYEGGGHQAHGPRDKALTAFAQLATLRLDVKWAMISLIDADRQYVLAKATKTLSLYSYTTDQPEDEVWLGNSTISKDDAACHHVFNSTYVAREESGEAYAADCLFVSDCREDSRFANKDYVKGESGVRFYAGAPIITKAGYYIGVYAVSDDKPREGLSAREVRFLQDIAATVMEHLELAKDSDDREKGERMVRGLTEFIERSSFPEGARKSSNRPTTLEKQTENSRVGSIADLGTGALSAPPPRRNSHKGDEGKSEAYQIFQRAAKIIRQSTCADGVVFFDTSAAYVGGHVFQESGPGYSSDDGPTSSTDLMATDSTLESSRRRDKGTTGSDRSKSSSRSIEGASGAETVSQDKACPVAGLSLRTSDTTLIETDFSFTKAEMERYIQRYPYGKFFNFDQDGVGITSGEDKSEKSENDSSNPNVVRPVARKAARKRKEKFLSAELLKVLPSARTLIFLPMWDPASDRWIAGGFIWTNRAGRLLSPRHELPYLKAFGNSITSEIARSHAQKLDRAKSTFIASISHELRSPLHGILGSAELLHDIVLSAFKKSLVMSIETCGRTLLDTIDHVLDYAKINRLQTGGISRRKTRSEGWSSRLSITDNSILGVTADFNLAQLVEEVCDAVCAGHAFRTSHSFDQSTSYDNVDHFGGHVTKRANIEAVDKDAEDANEIQPRVSVALNVLPSVNWVVRSQPGALRRIVMNLLGNALKFTDTGHVVVTLAQENSTTRSATFRLSIEDTGRGISIGYQHSKLFAPFSQEDPFSAGTGLGLSIVKQIVDSLEGGIDVQSERNVGTKVTVVLRLPEGSGESVRAAQRHLQAPETLKQRSAAVVFAPQSFGGSGSVIGDSLRHACDGLGMVTYECLDPPSAGQDQPNFLITERATLQKILADKSTGARPLAVICICTDPVEKMTLEPLISRRVSAFNWAVQAIAQPCGPRKLARLLLDTQSRLLRGETRRPISRSETSHPMPQYLPHVTYRTDRRHGAAQLNRSLSDTLVEGTGGADDIVRRLGPKPSARAPTEASTPLPPPSPPSPPPPPGISRPLSSQQPKKTGSASLPILATPGPTPSLNPDPNPGASPSPSLRVLLVDDNAINLKLLVMFAKRQGLLYSEATNGLEAVGQYEREALSPPDTPPNNTDQEEKVREGEEGKPTQLPPSRKRTKGKEKAAPHSRARTGASSSASVKARPFDFVLMDLSMPKMGGLEATRHIRQFEEEQGIAPRATIVALTGLASAQDQRDAVDAGVDVYLVKPVKFADVRRLFGETSASANTR